MNKNSINIVWRVLAIVLFIILMGVSACALAKASDLIITNPGDVFKDFTIEVYEDRSAALSLQHIRASKKFTLQANRISKGYSKSFFWLKFKIKNASNVNINYFIQLTDIVFHEIDCYIESSHGEFIKYEQGPGYFSSHGINELKKPKFPIDLKSGESKTVYLRLSAHFPLFTSLYILDAATLNSDILAYNTLYAFYFGSLFALLLSNLLIYLMSKEKAYLYYVLYVVFFLAWQLQTNAYPPFNLYGSAFSFYLSGIVIPIWIVFFIFFVQALLETKTLFPKMDRAIQYIAYSYIFFGLSSIFYLHESFIMINGMAPLLFPLLLYVGIKSYLAGNKVALFFIISQLIFIPMSTLYSSMTVGYLEYTLLNRHGVVVGSFLEIILFSLALAYRIKVLQSEKLTIINSANIELDEKVKERTQDLDASRKELIELANRDFMTNLYNRRFLYAISIKLISIAKRESQPLSLILFDIDDFKHVNDTYGHSIGDEVIKIFAKLLQATRECDIAARIGGEEFILLLPNTDMKGAAEIAAQVRKKVVAQTIQVQSDLSFTFTVSGGVSTLLIEHDNDINQVLQRADKALYLAKESGKNKIVLSDL